MTFPEDEEEETWYECNSCDDGEVVPHNDI